MPGTKNSFFQLAVIVSALGFFVDVYDLLLFGIIRKPSLADLGLSPEEVLTVGESIISIQMVGLLVGGAEERVHVFLQRVVELQRAVNLQTSFA